MTIKGTNIGAASIAQPDKGCEWYDGFYGINMTKPGAQEYYNSLFELFAQWGVDFVKADDMEAADLVAIGRASRICGRDMVISIVGSSIPKNIQKENAHMSRLGADFWDVWEMLKRGFPIAARAVKDAEPGGLLNRSEKEEKISVTMKEIGLKDKWSIRDIWKHKDLGLFDEKFVVDVPSHGCAIIRIEKE